MRLLITGATGFIGDWTAKYWADINSDWEVWTTGHDDARPGMAEDRHVKLDMCSAGDTLSLIRRIQPTHVIHLAGLVGSDDLEMNMRINVLATDNLLRALTETESRNSVKILQASSASVYGLIGPEDIPVSETQPVKPVSPYAISKLTQDYLALKYFHTHQLDIMIGRIFNIVGPGQPEHLVPMTFIKQIAAMSSDSPSALKVGNVKPTRDFVDVRDIVSAFAAILATGKSGNIYNIASGREISIERMIMQIIEISERDISIEVAGDRVRPTDVMRVLGDISKASSHTGWKPAIPLEQSLLEMWRDCAKRDSG
ncbi:MAG: NAD-dependent epimerase/dehydratase family protein [bacterium]|nr:NAD-dependent epimerase/dehydratase family protein [bacterium]